MRFVQFLKAGSTIRSLGVLVNSEHVADITLSSDGLIRDTLSGLSLGKEDFMTAAKRALEKTSCHLCTTDVTLVEPITSPDKVLCVGLNFHDHCKELGVNPPPEPVYFSKFSSCITSSGTDIPVPKITEKLDWEVELVIVVGKQVKNCSESEAKDAIFGYTVANDLTARDWQNSPITGGQWLLGKAMDKFCPLADQIVSVDELPNVLDLKMTTKVNGEVMQDSNTSNLIFKPAKVISYASQFFTLYPGDIILTGTPAGVGVSRKPPRFLKQGDKVEVEIEQIGKAVNTCV